MVISQLLFSHFIKVYLGSFAIITDNADIISLYLSSDTYVRISLVDIYAYS